MPRRSDRFEKRDERGKIIGQGLPDLVEVDVIVLVYDSVAHAGHGPPWNVAMLRAELLLDALRCLANHEKLVQDG